jgi:hypothetical protein
MKVVTQTDSSLCYSPLWLALDVRELGTPSSDDMQCPCM